MDAADRDYPPGDLRVSDAERDRAICELSAAFQAGRITASEFDERSGQALGARTGQELTALLADLPVERAPATRATGPQPAHRALAPRITIGAAAAATAFAAVAAFNASNHGPTLQQRELAQAAARRAQEIMGAPRVSIPIPPAQGFDWAGTITPAAIAVLLVLLIIFLRVSRVHRP